MVGYKVSTWRMQRGVGHCRCNTMVIHFNGTIKIGKDDDNG